jgi:hypothetical protein
MTQIPDRRAIAINPLASDLYTSYNIRNAYNFSARTDTQSDTGRTSGKVFCRAVGQGCSGRCARESASCVLKISK